MSAFDDAAREVANLTKRVADLEEMVRTLAARKDAPARIAYKPSEVAAMLGKNTRTIHQWIKDGRLPAEEMDGGRYAIPAYAVEAIGRRSA
jgi:excisionase family DNA binding protein